MKQSAYSVLAFLVAIGLAPAVAFAQDGSEDGWRVTVTPYLWGKSLKGEIGLAGFTAPIDIPLSDSMETLESVFMAEVEVRGPRWGGYVDYQVTDSTDEETVLGLPVEADIRLQSFTGAVYWRAHDQSLGGDTVTGEPRMFRMYPLVGARWSRARADLAVPGLVEIGKQAEWTDLIVGLRTEADVSSRWTVSGHVDMGGFDPGDRFSSNIQAHIGYRTRLFSQPAVLKIGYAVLVQDYSQDDFTGDRFVWDMKSHGPMAGLAITF